MKLIIAAALVLPITAAAEAPPAAKPQSATPVQLAPPNSPDAMNVYRDLPGCRPILRQVQERSKRPDVRGRESRTLDREPAAHLLLAVDRHVGGCREVTFLRRNAAPGSVMPNVDLKRD